MKKQNGILTLDMLKKADERIKKQGWIIPKTQLPTKRNDDFAKVNKRAEKLIMLFNR